MNPITQSTPFLKRTWAEIDLDAAKYNFSLVRAAVAPKVKVCAVVKANAYGHGAVRLGRLYEKLGADYLAVSNLEEALQIRCEGIRIPILILGYTEPAAAGLLASNEITQCVFSREYGEALSARAAKAGVTIRIHIKLDTGMGRIGFDCRSSSAEAVDDILAVCALPGFEPEGIFTHFASADEGGDGREFTLGQLSRFNRTVDLLAKKGQTFSLCHAANSAAIFDYPEAHLDMVRAGIILYGLAPSDCVGSLPVLHPVMRLVSIVDAIKPLRAGETVSYGRTFRAPRDLLVATVPIGYADGLHRSHGKEAFLVEGQAAPILGRICMDQTMIDVTDIPNVAIGSEVTVWGGSGDYSFESAARREGTIGYELLCAIGERVPRIYISEGKITDIVDRILF